MLAQRRKSMGKANTIDAGTFPQVLSPGRNPLYFSILKIVPTFRGTWFSDQSSDHGHEVMKQEIRFFLLSSCRGDCFSVSPINPLTACAEYIRVFLFFLAHKVPPFKHVRDKM